MGLCNVKTWIRELQFYDLITSHFRFNRSISITFISNSKTDERANLRVDFSSTKVSSSQLWFTRFSLGRIYNNFGYKFVFKFIKQKITLMTK